MITYPCRIVKPPGRLCLCSHCLQVRHLWQESSPTFVRFHENAFLCALKPIFSKKTLAFPCEKWYVVSQRGALDTRIFRLPAQPGLRPARSVLSVAIFFIYLLIIYPACPQGQKAAAQPARAAVFYFSGQRPKDPAAASSRSGVLLLFVQFFARSATASRTSPEK